MKQSFADLQKKNSASEAQSAAAPAQDRPPAAAAPASGRFPVGNGGFDRSSERPERSFGSSFNRGVERGSERFERGPERANGSERFERGSSERFERGPERSSFERGPERASGSERFERGPDRASGSERFERGPERSSERFERGPDRASGSERFERGSDRGAEERERSFRPPRDAASEWRTAPGSGESSRFTRPSDSASHFGSSGSRASDRPPSNRFSQLAEPGDASQEAGAARAPFPRLARDMAQRPVEGTSSRFARDEPREPREARESRDGRWGRPAAVAGAGVFRDVAALDASLGIDRTMAVSIKTKGKKKDERKEERSEEKAEPSEHDDKQTHTDEADDLLKQQSELELAMKNQTLVSVEDLNSGLKTLNLRDEAVADSLSATLARSLLAKRLRLQPVVLALKAPMLVHVLTHVRLQGGDEALVALADAAYEGHGGSEALLKALGADKMPPSDFDALLVSKGLTCLKPTVSLADMIAEAVSSSASDDSLLSLIKSHSKGMVADQLIAVQSVAAAWFKHVAAGPDVVPLIEAHVQLFTAFLFALQGALARVKAAKPHVQAAFQLVFESKIVSPRAFVEWKDDKKDKTPGKPTTLLAISKLCLAAEEACKQPEEEEEVDEDEDDDLLANPNRE